MKTKFQFTHNGYTILYGEEHSIQVVVGPRRVQVKNSTITISNPTGSVALAKKIYTSWLRRQARKVFELKLQKYSRLLHAPYSKLSIRAQKTRWGSCTAEGHISLNWKLLCTPLVIQDYVIIHEAAHLRHHHHRTTFWKTVEKCIPEYRAARKWLRANESTIQFVTGQFS